MEGMLLGRRGAFLGAVLAAVGLLERSTVESDMRRAFTPSWEPSTSEGIVAEGYGERGYPEIDAFKSLAGRAGDAAKLANRTCWVASTTLGDLGSSKSVMAGDAHC